MTSATGFTDSRRRAILDECFMQLRAIKENEFGLSTAGEPEKGLRLYRLKAARQRLWELSDEYRKGVPIVPLSRCPYCQQLIRHSLDTFGLDGLWWNYKAPVRPPERGLCPHQLALSGAVHLTPPVEHTPFPVCLGPEVPFVVRDLLAASSVRAVISQIRVGLHTAFPIFYFAEGRPEGLKLINTWGTGLYTWVTADGNLVWNEAPRLDEDYDFDLAPWLGREKAFWIAPGDEKFVLRRGVKGCPYLNLPGRRATVTVQSGRSWTLDDL